MAPIPLPPEPEFCLWVCWRSSPPFSCFGVTGVSTGVGASSWPPWNCCWAVTATACEYTSSEYAVAEIVLPSVGRAETRVVACSCVVGVSPVEGFKITTQFLHPQVIYFKFISFSYMYYGSGIWYFPMKIWSEHIKNEYINQWSYLLTLIQLTFSPIIFFWKQKRQRRHDFLFFDHKKINSYTWFMSETLFPIKIINQLLFFNFSQVSILFVDLILPMNN